MPFDSIPQSWIDVGLAAVRKLFQRIKDNQDYLYGQLGTQAAGELLNASLEVDSDADGEPDGWTINLYPGGAFTLDETSPAHGMRCAKFTHPGGSGNGGGYMDSDYVEIATVKRYVLSFLHWGDANQENLAYVRFYDENKSYISETQVFTTIVGTGGDGTKYKVWSTPVLVSGHFTCPANAKYLKVRLIGGHTDVDVAGNAYFDDVKLEEAKPSVYAPGSYLQASADAELSQVPAFGPTKKKEIRVDRAGSLRIKFDLYAGGTDHAVGYVYRNGVFTGYYGRQIGGAAYLTYTFDIPGWQPNDLCQFYAEFVYESGTKKYRNFRLYSFCNENESVDLDT